MMRRVSSILPANALLSREAVDRVVLDADDRSRRRIVLTGESGSRYLVDWKDAVTLRDGDGLVLDDGSIVLVAGKPEPLLEIAARTPLEFVRLAWHLGNRHTDVQIVGERIRIRVDHVLDQMVRGLGAGVAAIQAPFDPEPAAPGGHGHHGHAHDHDR
jgi:urease accessory protein